MSTHDWDNFRLALIQRNRGRPRSTVPELRENGYKDENGRYQLSELKPWHERVSDHMVAAPHMKVVDLARVFGVTPQWMGQLIRSDAFREFHNARMKSHRELMDNTIVAQMSSVASKSLEKMDQVLSNSKKEPTFDEIKAAAELSLKGLGYTQQAGVRVNVADNSQVTTISVGANAVAAAREKIAARRDENSKTLEHSTEDYQRVTASLEVGIEEVEDAVVISDQGEDAEGV